ncbi:MAG: long-chain fatty acid--CoA ligase [Bacteroidetes bacterium CG2_30_32_10]|nr:MAG: long-chain fatty acid--CoA ligase [Bacteroidetes bacterium CG2_30_32_10]
MEILRLFDLLPHYLEKYAWKTDALAEKDNGGWKKYSAQEYIDIVNNISYGFLKLGVNKDDKIATITYNRPEWNFLDMAIMQVGAIHVPIYPTVSESDYEYILNHAEIKYLFVAGEELYRKIKHILPNIPSLKSIYTFKNLHGIEHLNELIALGSENKNPSLLEEIKNGIKTEDLATIIYTSGTTGIPKGVMLSHRNIISNFWGVSNIPYFGSEAKALSFLPLCHVYERMLNYMYQYLGFSIYYVQSLATIADNMKEVQPDIMCAVPRVLEKFYDKIIATGRKLKGIKKYIFFWAVSIGKHYRIDGSNTFYYKIKLKIARKLVFSKWKAAFGSNIKIIVSGGASLQPKLAKILWAAGIQVVEGYGLTETSPVITVGNFEPHGIKIGCVGTVLRGVEVKIANDGEILCKGPNIMLGYYKDPEQTKQIIDEQGWFHTGDTGVFEKEGPLRITGRKKELFKTSFGKYIAPQLIEDKFKESSFIDNMIVLGENQKYAAALIVPDFNHLRAWCEHKEIEYTTNEEMINLPRIKNRFLKEVKKYNHFLGSYEQIKKHELLAGEWSQESGELTPTLKLKRNIINKKYKANIDKLFDLNN